MRVDCLVGTPEMKNRVHCPEERNEGSTLTLCCVRRGSKPKCNGKHPCDTCKKRDLDCEFVPPLKGGSASTGSLGGKRPSIDDPPAKKRCGRSSSPSRPMFDPIKDACLSQPPVSSAPRSMVAPPWAKTDRQSSSTGTDLCHPTSPKDGGAPAPQSGTTERDQHRRREHARALSESRDVMSIRAAVLSRPGEDPVDKRENSLDWERNSLSRRSTTLSDEEILGHPSMRSRYLTEPSGRPVYVGESATLSYLQMVRLFVSIHAGESAFTQDPRRFMIMEHEMGLTPQQRNTEPPLPTDHAIGCLVASFFDNTIGLVWVIDREAFLRELSSLRPNDAFKCHLYLIIAIGLILMPPRPEGEVSELAHLQKHSFAIAEHYFHHAKSFVDVNNVFDPGPLSTVQALTLMAVYTLATSRRGAAYTYTREWGPN